MLPQPATNPYHKNVNIIWEKLDSELLGRCLFIFARHMWIKSPTPKFPKYANPTEKYSEKSNLFQNCLNLSDSFIVILPRLKSSLTVI